MTKWNRQLLIMAGVIVVIYFILRLIFHSPLGIEVDIGLSLMGTLIFVGYVWLEYNRRMYL